MARAEAVVRAVSATLTGHVASPATDARLLLAHVLGVAPSALLTATDVPLAAQQRLAELVARRVTGVPLQHLTGVAHFRTVSVAVGPGVFVPRPETEVMTGWALERLRGSESPIVVELCAGSGAISLAIATEAPGCDQYAVEVSEDAVGYLAANLRDTAVMVVPEDMATALPELDGTVDLVIANPPYIPLDAYESVPAEVRDHDPAVALFSGADGLDAMRVVAGVAARLLRPGGVVAAEHAEVQAESAPAVFVRTGEFDEVRDHPDLTGRPRFVTAVRRSSRPGSRR